VATDRKKYWDGLGVLGFGVREGRSFWGLGGGHSPLGVAKKLDSWDRYTGLL